MHLLQRHEAISPLVQMIQRAEQEYDINARISTFQMASVTDLDPCQGSVWLCLGSLPSEFHVQGMRINQMHFIALSSQPASIYARAAANVENHGRRRWH